GGAQPEVTAEVGRTPDASSSGGLLLAHVVFDAAEHLEELGPVELEIGDVLFDVPGDLVDRHEEGQLTLPEGVEELAVVVAHPEDRDTVGDQLHLGEVLVHRTFASEVLPGAADALQRHAVVEDRKSTRLNSSHVKIS